MAIEFLEQLPETRADAPKRVSWAFTADTLRANPGQWARIGLAEYRSLAADIRNGHGAWAPAGAFEATSLASILFPDGNDKNYGDIYARYVGDGDV